MGKAYLGNTQVFNSFIGSTYAAPEHNQNILQIDLLLVGGGGAGGTGMGDNVIGGGGGAGRMVTASFSIVESTSFDITIGDGGVANVGSGGFTAPPYGEDGEDSTLIGFNTTYVAPGGGVGGNGIALFTTLPIQQGRAGGSSGGCGESLDDTPPNTVSSQLPVTGSPIEGFGNQGGSGSYNAASAGGGAGSGVSTGNTGGDGLAWLDGITYSYGGRASTLGEDATIFGGGGYSRGTIGVRAGNGKQGICKIRYEATSSRATGGDIQITGSYVYHIFDNVASTETFTFTG